MKKRLIKKRKKENYIEIGKRFSMMYPTFDLFLQNKQSQRVYDDFRNDLKFVNLEISFEEFKKQFLKELISNTNDENLVDQFEKKFEEVKKLYNIKKNYKK